MNLANLITLGRLLAVPLVVWLILSGDYKLTFWVFAAASISDAIDGYVAKHFDQRSDLGALLDPIADKTLIVSLFVTLGLAGDLPTWLVILVVFRDLLIIGGFLLAATLTQPIAWRPLMVSKVNTALLLVLVTGVLAKLGFRLRRSRSHHRPYLPAGVTTMASGTAYLVRWSRGVAGSEKEP